MNKLSYKIELTEIVEGYLKYKEEAFFYVVDGRKLEYQNYNPAMNWNILETGYEDEIFEEKKIVILNRCTCGLWECDCIVAVITEKPSTIQWQIHKLRDEKILATYEFEKEEYLLTMQQMQRAALKKIGKGSFFHWKDGSTYALPDTEKSEILNYWKQQRDQKTPLAYFEDIETGKLFMVIQNKEIVPYIDNNKTGEDNENN